MTGLMERGTALVADVLVIGGGLSGLVAAIKARESGADVLLVDRATIGWAGQATKAGNGIWVVGPDDDVDEFVEFHVKKLGQYLNDQELMASYARDSYGAVEELSRWGVQVTTRQDGTLGTFKHPVGPWSLVGIELDIVEVLRKVAEKAGVRTLDKVQVTDLICDGDRVVGAVGFGLIDMAFHVFEARATIIATAGCNYRCGFFNSYGDGIAAAYRVGAEMRNAEFGNMVDLVSKATGVPLYGAHNLVFNTLDENISERYAPNAGDVSISMALGMEKEVLEGRGPLYVDLTQMDSMRAIVGGKGDQEPGVVNGMVRLFQKKLAWNKRLEDKFKKYGPPPSLKSEVTLEFSGECSPINVNHEMKTTVPGLWATGTASWNGSAWQGALPPPGNVRGTGLMNAVLSGRRAGPSAAAYASGVGEVKVSGSEVARLKEDAFAPLERGRGTSPAGEMERIISLVARAKYSFRRSRSRLEEVLTQISEVDERLKNIAVTDGHGLGKYHEARSLALCARLTFTAALVRTESRGSHFRDDYPNSDDENWLKWIIVRNQGGNMVAYTKPIPISRYPVQPPESLIEAACGERSIG